MDEPSGENLSSFAKKQLIAFGVSIAVLAVITVVNDLRDEDSTLNYRLRWEWKRLRQKMNREAEIRSEIEKGIPAIEYYLRRIARREGKSQ